MTYLAFLQIYIFWCNNLEPANQMLQPPAVQPVEDQPRMPVLDLPNIDGDESRLEPNEEDFENEVR